MSDSTALTLTIGDINTEISGEPRMFDLRLADNLGYEQPRKIRELIERHRESLEKFGEVSRHRGTKPPPGSRGGRPEEGYWLNQKQGLFICTKSETPLATEGTIRMVEVFAAYLNGVPRRPITEGDLTKVQKSSLTHRADQLIAPVIAPVRAEMKRRLLAQINAEIAAGRFPFIMDLEVPPPAVTMGLPAPEMGDV